MECEHKNWAPVVYPEESCDWKTQSQYHVFCRDCRRFINLLTGEISEGEYPIKVL